MPQQATQDEAYARARKRARQKLSFYNHALVFGVIVGFLYLLNLLTSPG